jgi:transcriptional regulator with XRE-family HTH domain
MSSAQTARQKKLQAKLRLARLEAGLTQDQVAAKMGRRQTWISKCETGERLLDFVELEDFAALYGKPLAFFATR